MSRDEKSASSSFRNLLSPAMDSMRNVANSRHALSNLLLGSNSERTQSERSGSHSLTQTLKGALGSPLALTSAPPPPPLDPASPPVTPPPFTKAHLMKAPPPKTFSLSPRLLGVVHAMVDELHQQREALLKLNPSRRIQLTEYLEKIAQLPASQKTQLQDWVLGTVQHPAALATYLEEVALITLAQMSILKRWADKGLRNFDESTLGKLNWELSQSLKPYVPLHREGWHLTRPNLYSWFLPSPYLQKEIYQTLSALPLGNAGPEFISELCRQGRRYTPDTPEQRGYDPRFYGELAKAMKQLDGREEMGYMGPRKKHYYSPTLRFGELAHHQRESVQWIGFEENPFALLVAEIVELWWGPKAPPSWGHGNSLDAHPREQLTLAGPGMGIRTGILQVLTEMEACDMGFVLEERNLKAAKFRAQLDTLPFFKKLRNPATSLGTLQACVAITKIRPGGKFLWAREQPLSQDEGTEALSFLLGRAKLVTEWNLTGVDHSLPTRTPLYPKFIYLFERETDSTVRMAHRPKRVYARGTIRSHIEVPLLLEDIFQNFEASRTPSTRTNWNFQIYESPIPQKDWAERWPDQASAESLQRIEKLQRAAIPLAQLGTVRSASIFVPGARNQPVDACTLIITPDEDPRRLRVVPGSLLDPKDAPRSFAVILRDSAWTAVISAYLESGPVQAWLEHHAEKRGDRWHLTESLMKLLPIPSILVAMLERTPLAETAKRAGELSRATPDQLAGISETGWTKYILLSRARDVIRAQKAKLQPLTHADGVLWSAFIRVFSKQDCFSLTQHPMVRVEGRIPPNSPIAKIDRLKGAQPGIGFMTDRLETLRLTFEHRLLHQIVWDQVKDLRSPTWIEVLAMVQIPRALDVAESAALDLSSTMADLRAREKFFDDALRLLAVHSLGFQAKD